MSYELQFFSKHQNSHNYNAYVVGLGTPTPLPPPYHDGQNTSKVKLKVDAYYPPTHAEK